MQVLDYYPKITLGEFLSPSLSLAVSLTSLWHILLSFGQTLLLLIGLLVVRHIVASSSLHNLVNASIGVEELL